MLTIDELGDSDLEGSSAACPFPLPTGSTVYSVSDG